MKKFLFSLALALSLGISLKTLVVRQKAAILHSKREEINE